MKNSLGMVAGSVIFLTVLLGPLAPAAWAAPGLETADFQVVATLRAGHGSEFLRRELPSGVRILATEGNRVLLRSKKPVTASLLATLARTASLQDVSRDETWVASGEVSGAPVNAGGACVAPSDGFSAVTSASQSVAQICPPNCTLLSVCPGPGANTGREMLWAQTWVDGDLMREEQKRLFAGKTLPLTEVAVVDTGFDRRQKASLEHPERLRVLPGVTGTRDPKTKISTAGPGSDVLVGDPENDQGGHGTMVTSTIGGADGLGVSPHAAISVYRVTEEGEGGSTSSAYLEFAVRKACREGQGRDPDGVTVINMSWGSRMDESGRKRDDAGKSKKLKADLMAQGCLLVKSAGNDSFIVHDSEVDGSLLDDAVLRVGAIDASGNLSRFSSNGEVQAPGSDVFTLESTAIKYPARADNRCGGSAAGDSTRPRRFVNGTSFSSPITSGIGSEVVSALRASGGDKFSSLSRPDRIHLVNRVLRASMVEGSVNALRAMVIAERWGSAPWPGVPSWEALSSGLGEHPLPVCEEARKLPASCDQAAVGSCDALSSCFSTKRKAYALCRPPTDAALAGDLYRVAIGHGYLETASRYFRALREGGAPEDQNRVRARELADLYVKRWAPELEAWKDPLGDAAKSESRIHRMDLRNRLDMNVAQEFLPSLVHSLAKGQDPADLKRLELLLVSLLQSSSLEGFLERGPGRGSEDKLAMVRKLLIDAESALGVERVGAILKESIAYDLDRAVSGISINRANFVGSARVLESLIEPSSSLSSVARELEHGLYDMLKETQSFYNTETEDSTFLLEYHENRAYFDPLLKREESRLREELHADLTHPDKLPALKVAYALTHSDQVLSGEKERRELLMGTLAAIGRGSGWPWKYQEEFLKKSLADLKTVWDQSPPSERSLISERLKQTVASTDNPQFLIALIRSKAPSYDEDAVKKLRKQMKTGEADWMSPELVTAAARRLVMGMTRLDPARDLATIGGYMDQDLLAAMTILVNDPLKDQRITGDFLVAQPSDYDILGVRIEGRHSVEKLSSLPTSSELITALTSWSGRVYRQAGAALATLPAAKPDEDYKATSAREKAVRMATRSKEMSRMVIWRGLLAPLNYGDGAIRHELKPGEAQWKGDLERMYESASRDPKESQAFGSALEEFLHKKRKRFFFF